MTPVATAFDAAGVVSFLVGTVLPLAVAFVSKESWSAQTKGLITLALAGLTSVLTQWGRTLIDHTHFAWQGVVLAAVITYVTSAVSDLHAWKGGTAKAKLHAIGPIKDAPFQVLAA